MPGPDLRSLPISWQADVHEGFRPHTIHMQDFSVYVESLGSGSQSEAVYFSSTQLLALDLKM
jgi:hypothetical protein